MKIRDYYHSNKDIFYIVAEYLDGGEVFEILNEKGEFGEKEAAEIMK